MYSSATTSDAALGVVVSSGCVFFHSLAYPGAVDAGVRVARVGTSSVTFEVGLFGAGATTGGLTTGGTTTGGVIGLSGTTAGLAGVFAGTPLPTGAVFCAATAPGALANSTSAHMMRNVRIPTFDFMELALNPQDAATHCISSILANNEDEFDVNFAAIRKNNLWGQ
jgi:hypothetical protein